MSGLHLNYGLTDELRLAAIRDAERLGIERAADLHRVSRPIIYRWRKIFAAQIEENAND